MSSIIGFIQATPYSTNHRAGHVVSATDPRLVQLLEGPGQCFDGERNCSGHGRFDWQTDALANLSRLQLIAQNVIEPFTIKSCKSGCGRALLLGQPS